MELSEELMSIPEIVQMIADEFNLNYNDILGKAMIVKLAKSLYGLKQAGRNFNIHLDEWLKQIGFTRSQADCCLYRHESKELWILTYVDDILIMGRKPDTDWFKRTVKGKFNVKDLGSISWYLGMEVKRDRKNHTLTINQRQYLKDCLQKFDMTDCNPKHTPLPSDFTTDVSDEDEDAPENFPYRSIVGSILYAAKYTRPDIAHAIGCLSRHLVNPKMKHAAAVKHLLRYIKGTLDFTIRYHGTKSLEAWADADWGGDIPTRKSTTGFVILLNGGPVAYASQLQKSVALASASAEYYAAGAVTEHILFLRNILDVLKCPVEGAVPIMEDSTACIAIANNPITSKRTRHIEIKYHYIREQVERKTIVFVKKEGKLQLADALTKKDPDGDRKELNRSMRGWSDVTEEEC